MQTIIFTDLDGTLFDVPKGDPKNMKIATVDKDGHPGSYMSEKQLAFWEALNSMGKVIPVTGRSQEALARVLLPFSCWKIAAHGGVIIDPDGFPDEEWREKTHEKLRPLDDIADELKKRFKSDHARIRIVRERDFGGIYVSVKGFKRKDGLWQFLSTLCGDSFSFQIDGSDISVIPKGIGKEAAVRRVMEKIGGKTFSVGVGNSPYDLPFMQACDCQIPAGNCAKLLSFNIWRNNGQGIFRQL